MASDADEFKPFVTVIRQFGGYYAAVMTWDSKAEVYEVDRNHSRSKGYNLKTDANIYATKLAETLGMETRL